MKNLFCPLNPFCHQWDKELHKGGLRRGCMFWDDSDVAQTRNSHCNLPVEIVYARLVEV